jgi:hypothetical protein
MTSEIKGEFKRVENIGELNNLVGKLIQVYNPNFDEYTMGYLKRVEESRRGVKGEETRDIVIYLKDGVRTVGGTIDIEKYKKETRIHPTVYIPRVLKREISFMLMSEPSDESSIES